VEVVVAIVDIGEAKMAMRRPAGGYWWEENTGLEMQEISNGGTK